MWVKFVVGSSPCPKCFSPGPLVFLPPQKPTLQIQIWPGIVDKKSHLMKWLLLNFHPIPIDLFWDKSHYIICCTLKRAFLCFAASTRFVQCDKCNHFFLILSESDSKRYIHVKYNDKASGNEADKQSKAVQAPPPPPRKVCVLLCSSLINP